MRACVCRLLALVCVHNRDGLDSGCELFISLCDVASYTVTIMLCYYFIFMCVYI